MTAPYTAEGEAGLYLCNSYPYHTSILMQHYESILSIHPPLKPRIQRKIKVGVLRTKQASAPNPTKNSIYPILRTHNPKKKKKNKHQIPSSILSNTARSLIP